MKSSYDNKKLKEYEVKVLDEFVKICKEHDIPYFITYGTLLGAVRHKGFIPWDDDIDVHLAPEDYYKFKEIMKNNPDKLVFYQALETEKYYPLPFAKLRMNNTLALETKMEGMPIHHGIYIDIFPLVPYPDAKNEQKAFHRNLTIIYLLLEADLRDKGKYNTYGALGKVLSKVFRIIPRTFRNKVASRMIKKLVMYHGKYHEYIDIIDRVTFPSACFSKKIKVSFEGKQYDAPYDYDGFMTSLYGDYMTPPDENHRKGHSFDRVSFDKGE